MTIIRPVRAWKAFQGKGTTNDHGICLACGEILCLLARAGPRWPTVCRTRKRSIDASLTARTSQSAGTATKHEFASGHQGCGGLTRSNSRKHRAARPQTSFQQTLALARGCYAQVDCLALKSKACPTRFKPSIACPALDKRHHWDPAGCKCISDLIHMSDLENMPGRAPLAVGLPSQLTTVSDWPRPRQGSRGLFWVDGLMIPLLVVRRQRWRDRGFGYQASPRGSFDQDMSRIDCGRKPWPGRAVTVSSSQLPVPYHRSWKRRRV